MHRLTYQFFFSLLIIGFFSCKLFINDYSVLGCTDTLAANYNPEATIDDGSCEYDTIEVYGCRDSTATNYNSEATIDDGSCDY